MRTRSPLTLPAHGAVEFVAGLALMFLPPALSFGAAALVVCVVLGAILTGAALRLTATRPPTSPHITFDSAFVLVTAVAALALAVAGQLGAVLLLVAVVVLQAVLGFTTRYALAD